MALGVISIVVSAAVAAAEPVPSSLQLPREPTPALYADAMLVMSWKPRGVILLSKLAYRNTTHRDPESPLFDRTFWELGLSYEGTPAMSRPALYAEWLPLQVLRLQLSYGAGVYHGVFGLTTYPNRFGDWSEGARRREERSTPAYVHHPRLLVELRAKVWRIAASSTVCFDYFSFEIGAPYAAEMWNGLLVAREDLVVHARSVLVIELGDPETGSVLVGLQHQYRRALASGEVNQRLGVAFLWSLAGSLGPLDRPRFFALVGPHVEDRFAEGGVNVLMGVGAAYDFWVEP